MIEKLTERRVISYIHVTFDESSIPDLDKTDTSSSGESGSIDDIPDGHKENWSVNEDNRGANDESVASDSSEGFNLPCTPSESE